MYNWMLLLHKHQGVSQLKVTLQVFTMSEVKIFQHLPFVDSRNMYYTCFQNEISSTKFPLNKYQNDPTLLDLLQLFTTQGSPFPKSDILKNVEIRGTDASDSTLPFQPTLL